MAFKKIEIPEDEGGGRAFFKFNAIGDRLAGVFLSYSISNAGNYGPKPEYVFRIKGPDGQPQEVALNPPTRLAMALEKAQLKKGHKVIAVLTGEKDVGKGSPMKLFEVMVDDSPSAAPAQAAAPAPAAAPKPKPPPPPAGDEFDDIPV